MKQTTYVCDKCGQNVTQDLAALTVESGPMRKHFESIHLCGPCQSALTEWLNTNFEARLEATLPRTATS